VAKKHVGGMGNTLQLRLQLLHRKKKRPPRMQFYL